MANNANNVARLGIFLPDLLGAGAQRVMLNLAIGLASKGFPIDVVLVKAVGPYLSEVPESVRLVDLNSSGVLASLPSLVHYLRTERPIALLSSLHANIVAIWAKYFVGYPVRVLVSQHDAFSLTPPKSADFRSKIVAKLIKYCYPSADCIIAVSKGVAIELARFLNVTTDNIHVIYNPVITPDMQQKINEPLDHPWFRPGEPPILISVGSLCLRKDFSTLIYAFTNVRESQVARLIILGEGSERNSLEKLINKLDRGQDIRLEGFVQNPLPYMAHSSVFILSSKAEGLPTVLIEALYCGIPVISTDCPHGPREILDGGRYGILVPVGDSEALSQAIRRALAGEIPTPPRESWSGYDQNIILDQYLDIMLNG